MRVMENPWHYGWTHYGLPAPCLPICCILVMLWLGLGEGCQAPFSMKPLQVALDVVKIGHSLAVSPSSGFRFLIREGTIVSKGSHLF